MFPSISSRRLAVYASFIYSSLINFHLVLVHGQTPPNYIPATSKPLNVTFPGTVGRIYPGQSLQPIEASSAPTLSSWRLNVFSTYIAFMIDAEIIHSRVAHPLLHWYQPELRVSTETGEYVLHTSSTTTDDDDDDGTGRRRRRRRAAAAAYVGPQPNPGPRHSYVVLLFQQPPNYEFPPCFDSIFPISVETRVGFDLGAFMQVAGLGEVVGASYFTSQNEGSWVTSTSLSRVACATATAVQGGLRVQ